jgi:hypothetical protein
VVWIFFLLYWQIKATNSKATQRLESAASRILRVFIFLIAIVLLSTTRIPLHWLYLQLWPVLRLGWRSASGLYEAYADICGERELAYVFCMRSMASGGAFHCTFPHTSQHAFLEAHEKAFVYFGGVFTTLRYDNLKSAVKKILRGHQREESIRFVAFRSHWGFAAEFCTPGEGHEKGGVEGEGGYFRRNHLVPVPQASSWEELNDFLLEASKKDEQRIIAGRTQTVGAGMHLEREHLRVLAEEGFDLAAVHFPHVNASGCVRVLTNFYSVPLPVGLEVQAKVHSAYVEIWHRPGVRAGAGLSRDCRRGTRCLARTS